MKIVSDSAIMGAESFFSPYGEVSVYPGRELTAARVEDADVLLVRSVTPVDQGLLANSRVRFVGSATIGTDHIDHDYLVRSGIHFAYAPGCNATAVVQYVIAVLCASIDSWRDKSVSIIGCGQVGGRLLAFLKTLGMNCRVYDPFLSPEKVLELVDFSEACSADIICLHTPLTRGGGHPTFHMIGEAELAQLKRGTVLINAGRGAVIDNQALEARLLEDASLRVILDVWENEPAISRDLLDKVVLGTPHIAGHSIDGKLRGTMMLLEAFEQWLGITPARISEPTSKTHEKILLTVSNKASFEEVVLSVYDPRRDFAKLRLACSNKDIPTAKAFDAVRGAYQLRQEFNRYHIDSEVGQKLGEQLLALGFSLAR